MKTRRDYRTDLKTMSKAQLEKWIDRQVDRLFVDDGDASTPLLTKVAYAKELLKKGNKEVCEHNFQPCKHPAIFDFDKCTKCGKIR